MAEKDGPDDLPQQIEYHYQKTPDYRTVHADGAHGGATARGYLAVTFYNERASIPRKGVRDVSVAENGEPALSKERVTETLGGIMRQLEVTVMLDINAARELALWLPRKVSELEEFMEIPSEQRLENQRNLGNAD
jgi:hypothetical protein